MADLPPLAPEISSLIHKLPKVELHVHLEGTLEPEMLISLAEKNGVSIPYSSTEELRAAYRFDDLQSFLDLYYAGCAVLITREDFRDLTLAYLRRADTDNVRHVEPFFDPQTHTARGIAIDTVIGGIIDGLEAGERELGITWRLLLSFLRDSSEESAFATLAEARPWLDHITGVGLDSAEVGNPPEKFAGVYAEAASLGLKRVAHAGEEGSAELVTRTLDALHVDRIDHGVRSWDDPALVERLIREQIPLTVCPLSNYELRVDARPADSTLKKLLDAGCAVCVNSDDPAYFDGYIEDNYRTAAAALELTREELLQLARNAITGSFADDGRKTLLQVELGALAEG